MHKEQKSKLRSYTIGFLLSVGLTLAAFFAVTNHLMTKVGLLIFILSLAFVQLVIQLVFFLHMASEKKPRWNLVIFVSTAGIIFIVIIGSIWIMNHLSYNMTPQEMFKYVQSQDGL